MNSPAASGSARRSPSRWSARRVCCSRMSRRPRSRRDHPGADPEAARRLADATRHGAHFGDARSRRGRADLRPRRGDVFRPHRRGGRRSPASSRPPRHPYTVALLNSIPRGTRANHPLASHRRDAARPRASSSGVQLCPALPEQARRLRKHRPGMDAGRGRRRFRLPPSGIAMMRMRVFASFAPGQGCNKEVLFLKKKEPKNLHLFRLGTASDHATASRRREFEQNTSRYAAPWWTA